VSKIRVCHILNMSRFLPGLITCLFIQHNAPSAVAMSKKHEYTSFPLNEVAVTAKGVQRIIFGGVKIVEDFLEEIC